MKFKSKATITHFHREPTAEDSTRPLEFALIRRLFLYTRPYAVKRNTLLALVILRSIQLPFLTWMIGAIVQGTITRHDIRGTVVWTIGFLLMAFFTQVSFHFRMRLALELGESVMQDLRRDIFDHLMKMPMGFYNRTKLGTIISRITSDADTVRAGVQDVLFVSMVNAGQMLISGIMILYYDWKMFLVMLVIAPSLWGLNRYFHRKLSRAQRAVQESFSRVTSTLAESVNGIRVTQGFVRQELNAEFFRELLSDHSKYNLDVARGSGAFHPLLEMHGWLFAAVLLVIAGSQVLQGHMPLGTIIMLGFLVNMFIQPIPMLGNMYNQTMTVMAGAERVFRLLDAPPDWTDAPTARPMPEIRGHVEFQNVTFGYAPERPILNDISFVVEPGQTIALVGQTGSGKTSTMNLLAKFYLPNQGVVRIDGCDLSQVTSDSLRRQMGVVNQNNFLFSGTVMDNIRLGRPSATDEEIHEVARQLDLLSVIEQLSDGFQTPVGERGTSLSLGQRQLICFARACLANPRILILDEATSSVDTITETHIQKVLSLLFKGRTSFVIAHRLSTVRQADRILVFDQGRIIESDTHEQLIVDGGAYAKLYQRFSKIS